MFLSDRLFKDSVSVTEDPESSELYFGALPGTVSAPGYCRLYAQQQSVRRPPPSPSVINWSLPTVNAIGKRYCEISHSGEAAVDQTMSECYEQLRRLVGPQMWARFLVPFLTLG